jgi:hypothetical protein
MHTSVSRAYILCTLTYLTLQSLFAPLFSHSGYFIAVGIICAHGSCVRVCVSLMPLAAFYFSHAPPRRRVIHFLHVSRTREVCACILQMVKGKMNTHILLIGAQKVIPDTRALTEWVMKTRVWVRVCKFLCFISKGPLAIFTSPFNTRLIALNTARPTKISVIKNRSVPYFCQTIFHFCSALEFDFDFLISGANSSPFPSENFTFHLSKIYFSIPIDNEKLLNLYSHINVFQICITIRYRLAST